MSRGELPTETPWFVRTTHARRASRPPWQETAEPEEPKRPSHGWLPMPTSEGAAEGVDDSGAPDEPWVPAAEHAVLRAARDALAAEHAVLLGERDALVADFAVLRGERDALAAELKVLQENASSLRARVMKASEPELVRLASVVAERVVGRELRLEPELVVRWAGEAAAALGDSKGLTVTVSPNFTDAVPPEVWSGTLGDAELTVDPTLSPASCVVRAGASSVDVGASGRFASVVASLLAGNS